MAALPSALWLVVVVSDPVLFLAVQWSVRSLRAQWSSGHMLLDKECAADHSVAATCRELLLPGDLDGEQVRQIRTSVLAVLL